MQHAQGMKSTFERWYITAFQSLQVCSFPALPLRCTFYEMFANPVLPWRCCCT